MNLTSCSLKVFFTFVFIHIVAANHAYASNNLALNKPVTASSVESAALNASMTVDGRADSRWASSYHDNQWITVDLGEVYNISTVILRWEAAYGREYLIQTSNNGNEWTTVYTETNGDGGIDNLTLSGQGRYLRMLGIKRATAYGFSLWEIEMYGSRPVTPEQAPESIIPPNAINLALNRPVSASSMESGTLDANRAVDGLQNSRWASRFSDNQWISVDLGDDYYIFAVRLNWESAYAREYHIQVSQDGSNWTNAFTETNSQGGIETLRLNNQGRYLRVVGTKRATAWGISLWELEVYGASTNINLSHNKPATASSSETNSLRASAAVDGRTNTRWASSFSDNQWLMVDLGSVYQIKRIKLHWEAAFGRQYLLQTSLDGQVWSTIFNEPNGNGGIQDLVVDGIGRYVRMYGQKRATSYGFSLWEIDIYGYETIVNEHAVSSSSSNSTSHSSSLSSSSSSSSSSSAADTSAPTIPGAVTAIGLESRIELSWSPSIDNRGVTGYQIYRNNIRAADVSGTFNLYIDTNVIADVNYSYRVRARDAAGNWSALSTAVSAQLVTPSNRLQWSTPTARENGQYLELNEIGGYEIRYKRATDSQYRCVIINDNRINTYVLGQLEGNYQFEIAAFDTNGLYSSFVSIQPR